MVREWEEPRVGGASRRERDREKMRRILLAPVGRRHQLGRARDAPRGHFGGYPRYGPGRDRRSWAILELVFWVPHSDGDRIGVFRSVALRGDMSARDSGIRGFAARARFRAIRGFRLGVGVSQGRPIELDLVSSVKKS